MPEMIKIIHNNYQKITDFIMALSHDYVLKFNVELNRDTKNNERENYHKEFGYYVNNDYRVNIYRDMNPYLSIESVVRNDQNRIQIRIGMRDIYFFKLKLNEVIQWFTKEEFKTLFVKKDNRIIIPVKVNPIIVKVSFGEYIEFEPSTITIGNEQYIGVKVYLNSDNISFFMGINTLLSLNYFIDTFNMYQSSQLMLNYLGRPENGTNYIEYGKNNTQKRKSFFELTNAQEI